jgi:hypothetical protein
MSERKARVIWHGLVPDTDPIYEAGWNFTVQVRNETARERAMRMLAENPNCRLAEEKGTGYVILGARRLP